MVLTPRLAMSSASSCNRTSCWTRSPRWAIPSRSPSSCPVASGGQDQGGEEHAESVQRGYSIKTRRTPRRWVPVPGTATAPLTSSSAVMTERDDLLDDQAHRMTHPERCRSKASHRAGQARRAGEAAGVHAGHSAPSRAGTDQRPAVGGADRILRPHHRSPNPQTHSGFTLQHDQARILAHSLIDGRRER